VLPLPGLKRHRGERHDRKQRGLEASLHVHAVLGIEEELSSRDIHQIIRDMNNRGTTVVRPKSSKGAVASGRVHLSPLRGIPAVLEQLGVQSAAVLDAAGIRYEDFADPLHSEPFDKVDRLLGACVARTGCQHFGLLLSPHVELRSFGIVGRLARHAATVGDALRELTQYFALHDSGGSIRLAVTGDTATLSYGIHVTGIRNADQIYDFAVAGMCNVLRELCGPDWRPVVTLLPRRRPADIRPYRDVIQSPLRFDALQAAVAFQAQYLERPVPEADTLLHEVLDSRVAAETAGLDPVFHGDVRRAIRDLLAAGRCSRAAVARRLGLHERTLGRRLHAVGTTFQELLDATRAEIARQLLHDTRSTVARVARALGYSDPTAFTRAFRAWTGLTPREFRARFDADRGPGPSR
jgi:AraC-like DNA-binding protein